SATPFLSLSLLFYLFICSLHFVFLLISVDSVTVQCSLKPLILSPVSCSKIQPQKIPGNPKKSQKLSKQGKKAFGCPFHSIPPSFDLFYTDQACCLQPHLSSAFPSSSLCLSSFFSPLKSSLPKTFLSYFHTSSMTSPSSARPTPSLPRPLRGRAPPRTPA
ncbi:hypothetical protein F2P56_010700, partial [Juglans regia]